MEVIKKQIRLHSSTPLYNDAPLYCKKAGEILSCNNSMNISHTKYHHTNLRRRIYIDASWSILYKSMELFTTNSIQIRIH